MQKTLTFFRVFDLAFFAPGTILLILGWVFFGDLSTLTTTLGTAQITVIILGFIAAAFCSGLVIHSIVWVIKGLIERLCSSRKQAEDWLPFPMRFDATDATSQVDLILYFWYLRATCWNVACVLVMNLLSAVVFRQNLTSHLSEHFKLVAMGLGLAAAALIFQGYGFHRTIQASFELLAERKNETKESADASDPQS